MSKTSISALELKALNLVQSTIERVLQEDREEWVSAEVLIQRMPMFSLNYLRKYGYLMPREYINYYDDEGKICKSRYMYPIHRINRLVMSGHFRNPVHSVDDNKNIVIN